MQALNSPIAPIVNGYFVVATESTSPSVMMYDFEFIFP